MSRSPYTVALDQLFEQSEAPTGFLQNFFVDNSPTNALTVAVDIIRGKRSVAVDIIPGTGPDRKQKLAPYTNKEYAPPEYNESITLTAEEMYKRMPGATPYDPVAFANITRANILRAQREVLQTVYRAIELQARDALVNGQLNLVNNDVVDFKRKSTHNISAATVWSNPAADIITDLLNACNVNQTDGMIVSDIAILSDTSLNQLLNNTMIKGRAILEQAQLMDIILPNPAAPQSGAVFHGILAVGSYKLQLWTYPQFYDVPLGYGLPNEGQTVPYIPADKVIVMASKARYDRKWGGIATFGDSNIEGAAIAGGGQYVPINNAIRYLPYYKKIDASNIDIGVRSKPITIPTQIDAISVITTST